MANSATPIGKLMFSPIIKKADIRTAIIERRLRVGDSGLLAKSYLESVSKSGVDR